MVPVWMILSDHQGRDITQCQITQKRYKIEPYLQWRTNRKSYTIYRAVPFSMTFDNPLPRFQGHAIFDAEYFRNGTIYRHSFNGIVIGTYTRPSQQYRFKCPWLTLSDLAKYSMTRSARSFSATAELLVSVSYVIIHDSYKTVLFYTCHFIMGLTA